MSELFAISAAICIAMSGMLIGELNGRVHVLRLARWQMIAAFLMTGAVSLFLGGWQSVAAWQLGYLAASSFFGIIVASTTYFATIYAIGARNTALMFSLTAPFAVLLGYVVLGETISIQQGGGILLVLAGIILAIGLRGRQGEGVSSPSEGRQVPVRLPWHGIALGAITAFGQALGSLCARPAMATGVEPFTAMAIRSGIAMVFFLMLSVLPIAALRRAPAVALKTVGIAVLAAFLGTGLGMSLLMAALAHGNVGIVSTLSSMTPVVILPMVWFRTGVCPPAQSWLGACLAVLGTALITL
ncbi:DMT family transporter [Sinorhizobium sp. BG8]|uniref:DMT family transporter n=1 Tax=Sinorhizobium sp. BG8 TaxID=2613773 RepID=UPI00193D501A|nr:DMT family transporter [Sinorhizobium sp. BG8]QRM57305.1 DMT family transporter [Sinorhizobium sp. BG8]